MNTQVLLATFEDERGLLAATEEARRAGLRIRDAYTPYAVHGLDEAMGLRPSRLSWICAVLGAAGALFMFWFIPWCSAIDWPLNVGGKPWNSLLAYLPVIFESMVFCGGVGVVIAFLAVCRLWPGRKERLISPRLTDDQFALVVEHADAWLDPTEVYELLRRHGATEVRAVAGVVPVNGKPVRSGEPWVGWPEQAAAADQDERARWRRINVALGVMLAVVVICAAILPRDPSRRNFEFIPNMVWSPAYDAYKVASQFKQAIRPQQGAIARGQVILDYEPTDEDMKRAGKELKNPYKLSDAEAMERGRFVYQNFCAFCHGPRGEGGGPVTMRGYPSPPPFPTAPSREMPDGSLFHIITYGRKNMPSQRTILEPEDRWKVILYIRKLQQQSPQEQATAATAQEATKQDQSSKGKPEDKAQPPDKKAQSKAGSGQ